MTVKEFLLSLDPNLLAQRYGQDHFPAALVHPDYAGQGPDQVQAQLAVALLAFLGELKENSTPADPSHLLYTAETVDDEDPWFTAVSAPVDAFGLDSDGYPTEDSDTTILSPTMWPRVLGYTLHNRCRDLYGQGSALVACLRYPGITVPEIEP